MKGYKAFGKGMVRRGKQYEENKIFEEDEAKVCQKGMHFCKKPLDVLDYYPLVDEDGNMTEFAEVEALDNPVTDDNKIYCSKKLKIGEKISFAKLVQAEINFNSDKAEDTKTKTTSKNNARIGSSGFLARIGSSGFLARIGSSGDSSRIGSSGDWAQIGSSGDWAQIGSSGDWAQIGSSGDSAQIGSSGDSARIGSSGDSARIGSSGDLANIVSSGNWSRIGSSGDSARIGSSGSSARIGSSGDLANIVSSGDRAKISSSGSSARIGSSGEWAKISSSGKNCVIFCAGNSCKAKGKIGSWITLSEWAIVNGDMTPVCVKTEKIDGERIKEDTFYMLIDGEFVEVQ